MGVNQYLLISSKQEDTMKSTSPLRVCKECGLEAHSSDDLELFIKRTYAPHGRRPLCKKCDNERRRKDLRNRQLNLVEIFRTRPTGLQCHFCKEEVTKLKGDEKDSLSIHSLDGNHENWDPDNKVPTHHGCHQRFHKTGEKHYGWQGDEASDQTKYRRELRKRRRVGETNSHIPRGENHYNWKGDVATDHTKYYREYRRKKKETPQ